MLCTCLFFFISTKLLLFLNKCIVLLTYLIARMHLCPCVRLQESEEAGESPQKRSVRDSGYDCWDSERSESLSPPQHTRDNSLDRWETSVHKQAHTYMLAKRIPKYVVPHNRGISDCWWEVQNNCWHINIIETPFKPKKNSHSYKPMAYDLTVSGYGHSSLGTAEEWEKCGRVCVCGGGGVTCSKGQGWNQTLVHGVPTLLGDRPGVPIYQCLTVKRCLVFDSLDSFGSRSQHSPSPDVVNRGNSDGWFP